MKKLKLQTKSLTVDDAGIITGIAWPFGEPDSYGDVIQPGAFQIRGHVPMLWDHDHGQPIGIWESIKETSRGLEVRGRLLIDEVDRAAEVFALIKSGAIRGLSIGFWPIEAERNKSGGEDISALDLIEISCVSIPAHPKATITSAKSAKRGKGKTLKNALNKSAPKKVSKAEDEELLASNDNGEGEDVTVEEVDERVDALEAEVAEIKEMVAGTSETVEEMSKSLRRLVTKSGRPGAKPQAQEKPEEATKKAFVSYLRHGDKSPDVKALGSSNDGKGGYLAPAEFVKELLHDLVEFSPVRQWAKVGSTGNSSVIVPGRVGTTNATWVGEDEDTPESDFGFNETEIFIHELATFIEVANATLADAEIDIESEIRAAFAEDLGTKEGASFIYGTGVKQPEGFMNRADIETKETATATSVSAEELIDLLYSLPALYRGQSAWAMNGTTLAHLRKLKDLNGSFIWQPGLQLGQPETILGRPVIEMPDMQDIGTGNVPIVLADWTGYRIYDRSSIDVLVDPYSASKKRKTVFHVTRRLGAGVVEPKKFRKLQNA